MSWTNTLIDTYDNNAEIAGRMIHGSTLLPIYHNYFTAKATIHIDKEGNYLYSENVNEKTIFPTTERSDTRAGKCACPMPLSDNLEYIAKDAGLLGSKYYPERHTAYMEQLRKWVEWDGCPDVVRSIYTYLCKGTVVRDMQDTGIKVKLKDFVRFTVHTGEGINDRENTWDNPAVFQAYIDYMTSKNEGKKGISFVNGKEVLLMDKSPSGIRGTWDRTKIISSNKASVYTGRFFDAEQAMTIGSLESEKIHKVLTWLIERQGYRIGSTEFLVVWDPHGKKAEDVIKTDALMGVPIKTEARPDTGDIYAKRTMEVFLKGKDSDLSTNRNLAMIRVDSVGDDGKGRLAIVDYEEIGQLELVERINAWRDSCCWGSSLNENGGRTPSVYELARMMCGYSKDKMLVTKGREKNLKAMMNLLSQCFLKNGRIRDDMVKKTLNAVSDPEKYDERTWRNHLLEPACALFRAYHIQNSKEVYEVGHFPENQTRSYLFGRLLAVLDDAESYALYRKGQGKINKKRLTNARKLWKNYANLPARTAMAIHDRLRPYMDYLYKTAPFIHNQYFQLINEIMGLLNEQGGFTNVPLSEEYLLGYYTQNDILFKNRAKKEKSNEDEEEKAS